MAKLTEEEVREIEEGIANLRGPILLTWIRKLLEDRRERIAEDRAGANERAPAIGQAIPEGSTPPAMGRGA